MACSARKPAPTQLRVHPANWLAEHPKIVFTNNLEPEYGLACKSCHGADYRGGTSGVSCVDCHNQRGNACAGCHGGFGGDTTGAPPYSLSHDSLFSDRGVGGHPAMVKGGPFFAGTDCQTCHVKPAFVLASTHFTPSGAGADGRAEVTFSGLPALFSSRYSQPAFDTATGTCSNIYCHGAFPGGDTSRVMNFYGGSDSTYCGSCHAVSVNYAALGGRHATHNPAVDTVFKCATCHFSTVDTSSPPMILQVANGRPTLKHVNGVFDVEFDPSIAPLGLFDGSSCSGLPDSPGCHANRRDW